MWQQLSGTELSSIRHHRRWLVVGIAVWIFVKVAVIIGFVHRKPVDAVMCMCTAVNDWYPCDCVYLVGLVSPHPTAVAASIMFLPVKPYGYPVIIGVKQYGCKCTGWRRGHSNRTVVVEDLCIVHNIRISFGFLVHLTCQLLSRHTNNIHLVPLARFEVHRSPGGHRSWWHYV